MTEKTYGEWLFSSISGIKFMSDSEAKGLYFVNSEIWEKLVCDHPKEHLRGVV